MSDSDAEHREFDYTGDEILRVLDEISKQEKEAMPEPLQEHAENFITMIKDFLIEKSPQEIAVTNKLPLELAEEIVAIITHSIMVDTQFFVCMMQENGIRLELSKFHSLKKH